MIFSPGVFRARREQWPRKPPGGMKLQANCSRSASLVRATSESNSGDVGWWGRPGSLCKLIVEAASGPGIPRTPPPANRLNDYTPYPGLPTSRARLISHSCFAADHEQKAQRGPCVFLGPALASDLSLHPGGRDCSSAHPLWLAEVSRQDLYRRGNLPHCEIFAKLLLRRESS